MIRSLNGTIDCEGKKERKRLTRAEKRPLGAADAELEDQKMGIVMVILSANRPAEATGLL